MVVGKDDRKRFFFLQENPLRDCNLRTQQTLRRHTRNYVRACYLRLNSVSPLAVARIICHVGTKSARPFIAPSSKPKWGLTLIEPPHPYFHGSTIRSRSDGKKLSIPSTPPTPAARPGAPSTNSERRHLPALSYSNEAQSSDEYPGLPPFSPRSS